MANIVAAIAVLMDEGFLFRLMIVVVTGGYLLDLLLNVLNVRRLGDRLPEAVRGIYDEERYARFQSYEKSKVYFSLVTSAWNFVLLIAMLLAGGFAWLDARVATFSDNSMMQSLLFFGSLMLASDVLNLPFALYHTFVIEERFGFNRTTARTFVLDKIKGYVLAVVIGGGILALLVLAFEAGGSHFWWWAWALVTVLTLLANMFYTSLILPLFNKLTPLEEGPLRSGIEAYCAKVDFPLAGLFVMDGSRRSAKANAFFSGLGPKKKIVLFDTLIEKHTGEELIAVLAHEVGHYKKKHIWRTLFFSVLQTGLLFFLFGWMAQHPALPGALGAENASFHISLLAFALLYSPVSLAIGLLTNALSRKHEFEADRYAGETFVPEALGNALKKLSVDNLSNLQPHPLYVAFHYSHPPVLSRLEALKKIKNQDHG